MRLLITGSRKGREDVERWLDRWGAKYGQPELVIVGGAPGVDTQAELYASRACWKVRVVPAPWQRLGARAGPVRNQAMVDLCRSGDHCLAFPSLGSRGTLDCASRARAAGLSVFVLPPLLGRRVYEINPRSSRPGDPRSEAGPARSNLHFADSRRRLGEAADHG
jgi:hypothetical protein